MLTVVMIRGNILENVFWTGTLKPSHLFHKTITPTFRHGGGSVMVWGHKHGLFAGSLNSELYWKILNVNSYSQSSEVEHLSKPEVCSLQLRSHIWISDLKK